MSKSLALPPAMAMASLLSSPFFSGRRMSPELGHFLCFKFSFPRHFCQLSRCPSSPTTQQACTRRSRGEIAKRPNRKSWKQRTDMYMRPFLLNVFFSKRFIHAKVVHRGTSKVISVASTNAKDLRNTLPSLIDNEACHVVGRLIAERLMKADILLVHTNPRKMNLSKVG